MTTDDAARGVSWQRLDDDCSGWIQLQRIHARKDEQRRINRRARRDRDNARSRKRRAERSAAREAARPPHPTAIRMQAAPVITYGAPIVVRRSEAPPMHGQLSFFRDSFLDRARAAIAA